MRACVRTCVHRLCLCTFFNNLIFLKFDLGVFILLVSEVQRKKNKILHENRKKNVAITFTHCRSWSNIWWNYGYTHPSIATSTCTIITIWFVSSKNSINRRRTRCFFWRLSCVSFIIIIFSLSIPIEIFFFSFIILILSIALFGFNFHCLRNEFAHRLIHKFNQFVVSFLRFATAV